VTLSGARVLVTGSSGFVGRHLMIGLASAGAEAFGLDRAGQTPSFRGSLESKDFVADALARARPTHVIHLAGVLPGAGDAAMMHEENVVNTARLLDAIRAVEPAATVLVASSSAVYGDTQPAENPLAEDRPFRPISPYGVSKVAQEMTALQYHLAHGMRTVRVRTFNLVGPGQPSQLMLPTLARQVALGERTPGRLIVRAGNLEPRRDFVDVRDAVRAYVGLAAHGVPGSVYNVCGGRGRSVQDCLDVLARLTGRAIEVERDETIARRPEIAEQVGDYTRVRDATGWRPSIPFEDSVTDVLNEWREAGR
jgi:GDP-4-dehydro-6-deoxy-D-mannose reductase